MDYRKAIKAYSITYPNAICVLKGEPVEVLKEETNPDWLGWLWCKTAKGQEGWISKDYLNLSGSTGILICDYDAKEVSLEGSEVVLVVKAERGWAWIRKIDGAEGWVPLENLALKHEDKMTLFDRVTRGILEANLPPEQHQHIESYQSNISFWANRNLNMMRSWLAVTGLMLKKTYEEADVRAFFIRINGIVIEMADHFEEQAELYCKIFEVDDVNALIKRLGELKNLSTENYIRRLIETSTLLDELRSSYSDEELRWIKYFRNIECHPFLTKLSIKLKKSGLKNVENAQHFQRIAEQEDSLEVYEALYPKLQAQVPILEKIEDKMLSMRFS